MNAEAVSLCSLMGDLLFHVLAMKPRASFFETQSGNYLMSYLSIDPCVKMGYWDAIALFLKNI